ncbi:alpha/beta fold hydrolase [Devosia sediminis]|uniref:Alpha/beta fold hydrolase n=1 Tax=Devosia sediminis TaxID=2798801 RepID=A0A934ISD7_9HYPH|nr:alpha/beta fold hydrolase [Devosia sediminis]MBJ3785919.1 alpha/beta fold hydrolase [Devosia sediminis]
MEYREIVADDGTRLRFGLTGPESGPAMLLCHGLCAGGDQFAADATWFGERGIRVLLPDLRGHGQSGVPASIDAAGFSPERMRADLYAMADATELAAVHWVGNSLGGILGLGAAAEAPDRLRSLTLFGTALSLDLPPVVGLVPLLDIVPGRALAAEITARNTTRNRAAWPLIVQLLRQYNGRAVGEIASHVRRYDLVSAAQGWTGPALVLVGELDTSVNRVLIPQLQAIEGKPNWRVEHLAGGGHCANLDATGAWREAVLNFVTAPAVQSAARGGAY